MGFKRVQREERKTDLVFTALVEEGNVESAKQQGDSEARPNQQRGKWVKTKHNYTPGYSRAGERVNSAIALQAF